MNDHPGINLVRSGQSFAVPQSQSDCNGEESYLKRGAKLQG